MMNPRAQLIRWVPVGVYLLWSGVLLGLVISGMYRAYLRPQFGAMLLGGAIILLVFAAVSSRSDVHAYPPRVILWGAVALFPLPFIGISWGQSLGNFSLGPQIWFTASQTGQFGREQVAGPELNITPTPAVPPAGYGESQPARLTGRMSTARRVPKVPDPGRENFTLGELMRWAPYLRDRRIVTEGRVMRAPQVPQGYFAVVRFVMACCAADARPVGTLVKAGPGRSPKAGEWVRVQGVVTIPRIQDKPALCVEADRIEVLPLPSPQEQYLY